MSRAHVYKYTSSDVNVASMARIAHSTRVAGVLVEQMWWYGTAGSESSNDGKHYRMSVIIDVVVRLSAGAHM
jgi:hypothetical protein